MSNGSSNTSRGDSGMCNIHTNEGIHLRQYFACIFCAIIAASVIFVIRKLMLMASTPNKEYGVDSFRQINGFCAFAKHNQVSNSFPT